MKHLFHVINVLIAIYVAHFVVTTTVGIAITGIVAVMVITLIEFLDIIFEGMKRNEESQ